MLQDYVHFETYKRHAIVTGEIVYCYREYQHAFDTVRITTFGRLMVYQMVIDLQWFSHAHAVVAGDPWAVYFKLAIVWSILQLLYSVTYHSVVISCVECNR